VVLQFLKPTLKIFSFLQAVPKTVFAFTYVGPRLPGKLMQTLTTKSLEHCEDDDNLKYALIKTDQKRASWIEAAIGVWNDSQVSDGSKIQLHSEPPDDKIVTFTKKSGHTQEDHFIVEKIRDEQRKKKRGEASTYLYLH
jgi:hypothetical protein